MTLPLVWLPEAEAELREALAHYESIRPELGQRIVEAVETTVEAIAAAPLRFAVVEKARRRAGVRRFPYGIFFLVEETHPDCGDCLLPWEASPEALASALRFGQLPAPASKR